MKFIITPTYSDIFGEPVLNKLALIKGYSTEMMLKQASVINSELYLEDSQQENQKRILSFLLRRQSVQKQLEILKSLEALEAKTLKSRSTRPELIIFSRYYLLNFMGFLYKNSNDVSHNEADTSFEINFFKAYLCIVHELSSEYKAEENATDRFDWFRKNYWPPLISQIHSNSYIKPFNSFIKGQIFLNYFHKHPQYSPIAKEFFSNVNVANPLEYSLQLIEAVSSSWSKQRGKNFKQFFLQDNTSLFSKLFRGMTLLKAPTEESKSKDFYSLFKSKPLFELTENSYIVLDWDFLTNKLYDGLIYDFHSNSRISSQKNLLKYTDFISFTSLEITEKATLKNIVNCIFPKASFIRFDEGIGGPDAYVRCGKYIFIFEIKDAYFSAKAIHSKNYETIKEEIDKKYNTRKKGKIKSKGVWQLIESIDQCREGVYEQRMLEEQNLKRRNLVIYPILIYTDRTFSTPGIAQYLTEEFDNGIKERSLAGPFQEIKTLSFVSLDFFLENLHLLCRKETSLKIHIDKYVKRRKRLLKDFNEEVNEPFESLVKKSKKEVDVKDSLKVKLLLDTFQLLNGIS